MLDTLTLGFCLSYSPVAGIKYSVKSQLREKGLNVVPGYHPSQCGARLQELGIASHSTASVRKQREINTRGLLAFSV